MTQIWFYHLESQPLERVLPALLEKCGEKRWKAVLEVPDATRLATLDDLLWTYDDASFLPHGTGRDGDPSSHPIFLTNTADNPSGAVVRFCVDGADPAASLNLAYERIFVLFDGRDEDRLQTARHQWAALKGTSHERAYWRQNADGRWDKKA